MFEFTQVDRAGPSARLTMPARYNAALDFVDRNLDRGLGKKIAIRDDSGTYTYEDLAERVNRAGNGLRTLGVEPGDRVMMVMADTVAFPAVFFGAIRMGAVPIPVNTMLTPENYDFMLRDSGARALVVSDAFWDVAVPGVEEIPTPMSVIVDGMPREGAHTLSALMAKAEPELDPVLTAPGASCFWLYTSGSTGQPKGVIHAHKDMVQTAELYGVGVLGIGADDVVFSAAKLFFAYGLGNSLSFPFYVGATAVLMAERPTPEAVMKRFADHCPSIFYGVPTLYAGLLASGRLPEDGFESLRRCTSAGEALPQSVAERWQAAMGIPILDGIGSTEMLHIFLSNRPGDVRHGTTGKPVPGYELKLTDDAGVAVAPGEVGDLWVKGPSSAREYWNQADKGRNTFVDGWTRTGDKYALDNDGYHAYQGRSDDMLKVGGIYVSPFEVEGALMAHSDVLEAAVVGHSDDNGLIKPKAFVLLNDGARPSADLKAALKSHVKAKLAPFKYPRWIEFVDDLPRTATGKIQRFKLRGR